MRIRGDALAFAFLAITEQLLLAQAPFDKRPRVDAGRYMTLNVDQVAAVGVGRRMPEVSKADVVEQRRRLEARDVPPRSADPLFARRMIATAFQRIAARILCSS